MYCLQDGKIMKPHGFAITVDGWNSGTKDPAGWECFQDRTKADRFFKHMCKYFKDINKDRLVEIQKVTVDAYPLMSNRVYFNE